MDDAAPGEEEVGHRGLGQQEGGARVDVHHLQEQGEGGGDGGGGDGRGDGGEG